MRGARVTNPVAYFSRVDRASLRSAFALALPASLAAMITPLLGIVDTAFLARTGDTAQVAGVALAGAVFSILYWSLGFLRMSVAGLSAQSAGGAEHHIAITHLVQGILLGGAIGLVLVLFRGPISHVAYQLMAGRGSDATPDALAAMTAYIRIRLLAAPFAIASYAAIGFLTGQGRTGRMMLAVVIMTVTNGILDWYFVVEKDQGAAGIALGTALAETAGFFLLLLLIGTTTGIAALGKGSSVKRLTHNIRKVVILNGDIFIRTLALALVFAWFTRAGTRFGDLTVAANQVLMQITLAAGLVLDGPAIAAESLVGRAIGQPTGKRKAFGNAVAATTLVGGAAALGLTALLLVFGELVLEAIVPPADSAALLAEANRYRLWACLSPLLLFVPFQLDGIYIGATRGAALRNSMLAAAGLFGLCTIILSPLGNHGLWLGFGVFMLARGAFLLAGWGGFGPLIKAGEND